MGKAVQPMSGALHHFGIDHGSGAHTQRSESGNLSEIVHEIHKNSCVFTNIPGHKHTSFPSITCSMFGSIDQPKFQEWMDTKFAKLYNN